MCQLKPGGGLTSLQGLPSTQLNCSPIPAGRSGARPVRAPCAIPLALITTHTDSKDLAVAAGHREAPDRVMPPAPSRLLAIDTLRPTSKETSTKTNARINSELTTRCQHARSVCDATTIVTLGGLVTLGCPVPRVLQDTAVHNAWDKAMGDCSTAINSVSMAANPIARARRVTTILASARG